jgi:hypothetical protein
VTFVIGRRSSGKSRMLSDALVDFQRCLVLVNTEANAAHHAVRSGGARVILLDAPLAPGELWGYCVAWNATCLLIDDANATRHDVMFTEALELARSGHLERLVVSVNHPLMVPLSVLHPPLMLPPGCNITVDFAMLSHYTDPCSTRVMRSLRCTYPFQLDANCLAPRVNLALNTTDSQLGAPSSQAPINETPVIVRLSCMLASTSQTQSESPKHSTCRRAISMSPCAAERTWHVHPSE